VREKNKELQAGSWVHLRREVHDTGTNPKLEQQVDGPYRVVETDGRTFVIQHGEEQTLVSSDLVTPAPAPLGEMKVPRRDPTENERTPDGERAHVDTGDPEEKAEYVFEKILGVRQMANGTLRYRVRWYENERDSDTWEPANNLPESAIRRYHRRTRLPYSQ
jgi:Chromo (CHRromatin Organisation MOdifier) domain